MIEEDGKVPDWLVANVDARLRDLGKNRTWLAATMNVSPSLLGRILNRRTGVKLETLQRITNALSWRLPDLFTEGERQISAHEPRTKDELVLWLTAQHNQTLRYIAGLWAEVEDRAELGAVLAERLTPERLNALADEVLAERPRVKGRSIQPVGRPPLSRPGRAPSGEPASSNKRSR